jgi:glycosyltransferase involved in cell wall biosynthesis
MPWQKLVPRLAKEISEKKTLNICLVAQRFPILGRASDHGFLWPIAKGLVARGHKVTAIASRSPLGKHEVNRDGVRVFYLNDGPSEVAGLSFEEGVFRKFQELHRQEKFDLIHSIDRSGYRIGKYRKRFGVTVVYDVEATQMAQLFSILGMARESARSIITTGIALIYKFLTTYFGGDRELLATASGVFVTSPQQRIFLERYYLFPDIKTFTAPYGIELADLTPRLESQSIRQKLKIPTTAHIVLTITDMAEPQEVINLLKGFERVAVKKPNSYMIIIGNGPGWKEIEYNLYQLALGSRVFMVGALSGDEISDWISTSEVYVNLSSRTTGFEPTMIEAMAQKKVIIGSEVSPIANIVEDGIDGFLIRPADSESLSHLLIEIFSGLLASSDIGQRARDRVMDIFDSKKMVSAIEEAYHKAMTL